MKTVTVLPFNNQIAVRTGTQVSQTLLVRQCNVTMACGGRGVCATCHVHVRRGQDALSPMTEREKQTLGQITGVDASSRLSCQACILGEGVAIELPEGRYLKRVNDLLLLIGKRATEPILHPRDGRVLIEKGKIITRSRILQLENERLDPLTDKR